MIPHFGSATSKSDRIALAPPQGFRPVSGRVLRPTVHKLSWVAPGRTAAQRLGLRYEDQAQNHLSKLLGPDYYVSPWIRFVESSEFGDEKRACVPDGLLIIEPRAFIFEIKVRHTSDSWFQLRKLYGPVVAELPFVSDVVLVEVCRLFDPGVEFPEQFSRVFDLTSFIRDPWSEFGVFSWKPE